MYEYKAKIVNVVDGDTFDLDIDLGFHITIRERVRLLNIDTPEKRGAAEEKELGLAITRYVKEWLEDQPECLIRSYKGTDSFGRWLVDLVLPDGENISEIYNELGFNKWCDTYSPEKILAVTGKQNTVQ